MKRFQLQNLSFHTAALILVALNLIDAASTHLLLALGLAYEINPFMLWAFQVDPLLFWTLKLLMLILGLLLVAIFGGDYARKVLAWVNLFYLLVLLTHLIGWLAYLLVS